MSAIKAFVQGAVGRLLFRNATILRADALGPRFRRLVLGGPELAGVTWTPGDKLQVFLPGVGTRTYTPTRWDGSAGETELIAFLHGQGPGARWASDVQVGDTVQVFGPRGSLVVGGSSVVVGDETSLGLVCAQGPEPRAVLEVTSPSDVQAALDALELSGITLVERAADDAHGPALVDAVARALADEGTADRDRLELSGDWLDGEDYLEAAAAGATARPLSFDAGSAYAVLAGVGIDRPGLYEGDGTVTAAEAGLRLHGYQFTPKT